MNEQQMDRFILEVQDRIGDAMAAIQVLTPLIQEKGRESDKEYLAAIKKSFYRMVRAIHNAKVNNQEADFRPKSLDLAGFCMELGSQCEDMARLLKVNYTWDLAESSVLSYGDSYLLQVAILNLLTNAFEAAGPEGHVTLQGKVAKGYWTVTVEDDGPGFRERSVPEDPFLKVPGGVGLGLDVVRKVAQLHGGTLMREDKKEGGVRQVLSLSIKPVTEAPGKEPTLRDRDKDLWGGFPPMQVEFSALLPLEEFSVPNTD